MLGDGRRQHVVHLLRHLHSVDGIELFDTDRGRGEDLDIDPCSIHIRQTAIP